MMNLSMVETEHNLRPRLTVMGVGGAGGNAINNMIRCALEGCDFIAANTDSQALAMSLAPRKIQLGINMSRGLGAGSKPDIGRAAAEEQLNDIMACLEGSDMLFVTAGMGGGTGTGAAPVIARAARESGILTVGVVTRPFHFEGSNRMKSAEAGIAELQQYVDTLIVIPNQNLFRIANERTTFAEAFRMADEVLHCGVRGITDLMVMPGFMNLDFADVKTVMGEMGKAMMGTGEGTGENRAIQAAEAAISNPLLDDVSMKGARGVLINITGGMDMTLFEVDQAANRIREEVDPEAQIKVGSTLGDDMDGSIRVSVIATGIDASLVPNQRSSGGGSRTVPTDNKRSYGPVIQTQNAPAQTPVAQEQVAHPAPVASQVIKPSINSQSNYFTMPQAVTPQHIAQQQVQQSAPQDLPVEEFVASDAAAPQLAQSAASAQSAQPEQAASQQPPQSNGRYNPQAYTARQAGSHGYSAPQNIQRKDAPAQQPTGGQAPFDMRITQLATPAQQAAADQRRTRRSESLFTRITGFGMVRPSTQKEAIEENDAIHHPTASAQSSLDIRADDRPQLSADHDDDKLDIPAFLRRQTNH